MKRFYDAILQRVETDDHQPAAFVQFFKRSLQASFQISKLVVNVNSDRLKTPGRGVLVSFSNRDSLFDNPGQLAGCFDG